MNYTDDQLKQRNAVSDTPRTDAAAFGTDNKSLNRLFWIRKLPRYVVPVDFARTLERELAAVTAELSASQQEAQRLREALGAIMESAKVAYCATTDPMMTDALVGIGKRCKDAIEND